MTKSGVDRGSLIGLAKSEVAAHLNPPARRLVGLARSSAADLARSIGVELRISEPLRFQWERIMRESGHLPTEGGDDPTRVLIASGYGLNGVKLAIESILAVGLRLRGASVQALICGGSLSACEFNPLGNFNPVPGEFGPRLGPRGRMAFCEECSRGAGDTFAPIGVPVIRLNEFEHTEDLIRVEGLVDDVDFEKYRQFRYRGVSVGEHAFSSVLRATLRGTVDDSPKSRWLFRRYIISSMRLVDQMERLIDRQRPQRIVAVHGVYLIHGTICEVARKHDIPVIVFGVPYRQGTVWASHGDTYHRTLVTEPVDLWAHQRLTDAQNRRLDEYLDSKRAGGRDYVSYHPNPVEDREQLVQELGIDPGKPVISLFTNVIWDAQIYYDYNAFPNILEWVYSTIRYFESRPDLQLVIRVHPAEVKGGMPTNQPILPEIEKEFAELPENVKIVPPESDLSSYTLASMSKAALIYGTKMGLEIAIRGIPVVVAGETFSRGKGFTYDITTAKEYFDLLDRITSLPPNSADMVERARRYAYYLFFRRMIDFPLIAGDPLSAGDPHLRFREIGELAPGHSPAVDVLCDGILDGTPFMVQEDSGSGSIQLDRKVSRNIAGD